MSFCLGGCDCDGTHMPTREERLEAALRELLYQNPDGTWHTGVHGDEDVTDIIGDLLE